MAPAPPSQPVFYYDLGSPLCYLAAEQMSAALPVLAEWEPVLAERLGAIAAEPNRALIERLAAEQVIQPLRWPRSWPPQTHRAMLAASYAKKIGRGVAFSLAAFRQAFAGGRELGDEDTVLLAAAACEMHPAAILKGIGLRSTADALDLAVQRARAAGVRSLPAIQVRTGVYEGIRAVERAAQAVGPRR